jgi:hypothetical protein
MQSPGSTLAFSWLILLMKRAHKTARPAFNNNGAMKYFQAKGENFGDLL